MTEQEKNSTESNATQAPPLASQSTQETGTSREANFTEAIAGAWCADQASQMPTCSDGMYYFPGEGNQASSISSEAGYDASSDSGEPSQMIGALSAAPESSSE